MPLVLKERVNRKGVTTSFDVVRAQEGSHQDCLKHIPEGEYRIMDGAQVKKYKTSYRVVQDIEPVSD